eukprot:8015219-Pyramimonas_sp.AAC.1
MSGTSWAVLGAAQTKTCMQQMYVFPRGCNDFFFGATFWKSLGPFWGPLGPSCGHLGPSWGARGTSRGPVGPPWGPLGTA